MTGPDPKARPKSLPLVTVIVPVHNRARLVTTALDSVRAQTHRPIELIVVDDGSTDDTAAVVEAWLRENSRPDILGRLIRQANAGAPAARNNGLANATGAFVQFLDSDDALAPGKIAGQVRALEGDADALFAWSNFRAVNAADEIPCETAPAPWTFERAAPRSMPGMIVRGLFRAEACRRMGPWNETLKRYQDWEYSIRYLALGAPTLCSPDIGYFVIAHGGTRIDDVNKDARRKIDCLKAAARAAAEATAGVQNRAVATKIAQRYSMVMVEALALPDRGVAKEAIGRLRRHASPLSAVRLKNELLYGASLLLGPRVAGSLAKRFSG